MISSNTQNLSGSISLASVLQKSFISTLPVTNDHAERAIALVEDFSGRLTKDEQQLQFVLSVVDEHHKKFPDSRK